MKISKLIQELVSRLVEHGDLTVVVYSERAEEYLEVDDTYATSSSYEKRGFDVG